MITHGLCGGWLPSPPHSTLHTHRVLDNGVVFHVKFGQDRIPVYPAALGGGVPQGRVKLLKLTQEDLVWGRVWKGWAWD